MFGTTQQKTVAGLIIFGIIAVICGGGVSIFLRGITLLMPILGVLMIFAGLYIGYQNTWGTKNAEKPVRTAEGAYIMSILVTDRKGEMVFDPEFYEPKDLKYLVQIRFANGSKEEFETDPLVLSSLGEGMKGRAHFQGKWLCQFEPVYEPRN